MRDRLIELISQVLYMGGLEGKLADNLLATGVIVPPCKAGSDVYVIDGNSILRRTIARFIYDAGEGFWGEGLFGKTVFLTREEAEKALAERREG